MFLDAFLILACLLPIWLGLYYAITDPADKS